MTTLYAIFTTPAAFIGTHPVLAFVGVVVELAAVAIALVRLRRRDTQRAAVKPVSPHPGRSCDQTCDVTDDAHDGCVWSAS